MPANSFQSLMGYGASAPINPYTGQPDLLAGAQSPLLGNTNIGDVAGAAAPAAAAGMSGWGSGINNWMQDSGFLGSTGADGIKTQGWGGTALGVVQGIGNAFMGMKQYGLAKDQLAQSKKQFELNFGAQQKTTNAALEDRQAARVASNPGAYTSVGEYMKKNGI